MFHTYEEYAEYITELKKYSFYKIKSEKYIEN